MRLADADLGGDLEKAGPSALGTEHLGILDGPSPMVFVTVPDIDRFMHDQLPSIDANGSLGVVERQHDDRLARILLDTYLLGSSRESVAAADLLEEACHGL